MNEKQYELSDAAKAEIQAAIRIVREDRFERHAREVLGKHTTQVKVEDTPEIEAEVKAEVKAEDKSGPTPPPAKTTPEPPAVAPRRTWGLYADDE